MQATIQPVSALRRALGRWDLTAIGVNQVIGGAIFVWPAQVAAQVGAWSPIGFVLVGLLSLSVALCFAEVGSRFEGTGGTYLYSRVAFGDFIGFEIGWLQWFARATSQASIMVATTLAVAYYWPSLAGGWPRAAMLLALTIVFAAINVRGVKQSAWTVNVLTIGKLVPLALFIAIGLAFVRFERLTTLPPITLEQAGAAGLLLIFIYGGYEVVPVPAGEALNPKRDVPFAIVATVIIAMIIMTLTQIVAQGVLPDVAAHTTPIADAAAVFLGVSGALLIGVGSVVSMSGNNAGQVLNGSRMLFALAEQGQLPAWFGRVHSRFRTPTNAILFTSAIALGVALSGTLTAISVVSALARVLMYAVTAAATLRLRRMPGVNPATFRTPMGSLVPVLAMIVCVGLAAGATRQQMLGGLAALAVGAGLFLTRSWLMADG
jgi:basic amino acid/polyamine antiporter, APA family